MTSHVYTRSSTDYIDLNTLTQTLIRKKWLIIAISLFTFSCCMLFALVKPPLYQASTLLFIQQKQLNKSDSTSPLELSVIPTESTPTQIALIHSNLVLHPVIKALNLDILVIPYKKGYFNHFFHKASDQNVDITELQVPKIYLNKPLYLDVIDDSHYQIFNKNGDLLITGTVGEMAKNSEPFTIKVNKIIAAPGAKFTIIKYPEYEVLSQLQKKISIVNLTGTPENGTSQADILQISLTGKDPDLIAHILNQIALVTQQTNIGRKIVEADNMLDFLKKQIIITQQSLQDYESKFNQYRSRSGKIDIKLHTEYLMNHISDIDKEIDTTHLKKIHLLQQYTQQHPEVLLLNDKTKELEKRRNLLFNQLKRLPAADQISVTLAREINVKNNLYVNLLQQIHELEVLKSGMMSDIRILSPAKIPEAPLPAKLSVIAVFSIFIGLILGCIIVLTAFILKRRVNDPLWIEKVWGIKNLAIIPFSKSQAYHDTNYKLKKCKILPLLTYQAPNDPALDRFYMLRTLLLKKPSSNIITLTGLSNGSGKSFVTVNLGALLTRIGYSVLLIDADIQNPHMHNYFSNVHSQGLSDIIHSRIAVEEALIPSSYSSQLMLLPAGSISENPFDLLTHSNFKSLVLALSKKFQYVIINAGSNVILSDIFQEALHLFLINHNTHKPHEIDNFIKNLNLADIQLFGSLYIHSVP